MVLLTKKGNSLPEEAVQLPKNEALQYQKKFIENWPLLQEVFFIKYGGYVSAGSSLISSYLIFKYFKRTLNLKTTSRTTFTLLPSVIIPAAFSPFFTEKMLTEKVLLMEMTCPLCQQLTFGLCHVYISVLYPALYSYISLSSIAYQINSYNIPNIKTQPKEYWRISVQILKKSGNTMRVVGLIQTAVILMLPFLQNKELVNITNKANEIYHFKEYDNFPNVENKL